MKKILIVLALVFIILIGFVIFQIFIKNGSLLKTPTATIKGHEFKLYIAKDPKDYQIGLSKYNKLPQDYGMLFSFEKADYYSFWMKEMKFPIDIIYMRDNQIVTIIKNAPVPKTQYESLPVYKPTQPADEVLEVNAGISEKYNFKEKDEVKYENIGN